MRINIKDLFSKLNIEEYKDINIDNNLDNNPNFENIKNSVLDNINTNNQNKNSRFKVPVRNMWVAALILCITATTVFAFSNIEFFINMFGNDVEITEKDVQDVVATVENENFIFSVESLLSDGNQNYFVISLESKNKEEIGDLSPTMIGFDSEGINGLSLLSTEKIDDLSTSPNKTYYLFKVNTRSNLLGKNVEIFFARNTDKEMKVSFDIEDNNNLNELEIEDLKTLDTKHVVTKVTYSNLGMNIEGEYIYDTDLIPNIKIKLKYKDGSIEEVSTKSEDSDKYGFVYGNNEEGFTNTIIFKELVDFDLVEGIILEGKEFKIK